MVNKLLQKIGYLHGNLFTLYELLATNNYGSTVTDTAATCSNT